ncbi:MAG: CotH kinase family protein [Bacteroidales bacterium]|nr:CotH kinase family protein [Bacteroidales bacterium]
MKRYCFSLSFLTLSLISIAATLNEVEKPLQKSSSAYNHYTDLPTIHINTNNSAPINSKINYVTGTITIVSPVETEVMTDIPMQIRGRGNSTWGLPKKPYKIKLDNKASLLSMKANAKDWVLLANYGDKSLIRNALAFEIGKYLGMSFTPSVRFVDLAINGDYVGNYMVTDQIEIDKQRVAIKKQDSSDVDLPNITGGYLLEIDGFATGEAVWFQTSRGLQVTIKSPDEEQINANQKAYISDYIRQFEDVVFSSNYKNPETGYRAWVDTTSLINWYIACELTGNPDCFWSTYIYKQRNDPKIYWGPLWDYDIAFDNDNRFTNASTSLMRNVAFYPPCKNLVQRFWSDPWFVRAVNRRWNELLQSGLSSHLDNYITQRYRELYASQELNYERWPVLESRIFREIRLFSTYDGYINDLSSYVTNRISFLTNDFAAAKAALKEDEEPEVPEVHKNPQFKAENYYYSITNIKSGLALDIIDQTPAEGAYLNLWTADDARSSQLWQFTPVSGGYYSIREKENGLAVKCGTSSGESLSLATPDTTDSQQLWKLDTCAIANAFGLINKATNYSLNNSGGGVIDGTKAIGYTYRMSSQNQQWILTKKEAIAVVIDSSRIFIPEIAAMKLQDSVLYRIKNVRSDKYVTASGIGMDLLQDTLKTDSEDQFWYFTGNNSSGYHLFNKKYSEGEVFINKGLVYANPILLSSGNAQKGDWYIDYSQITYDYYGIFARYATTDLKYWNDYQVSGSTIGFYNYDEGSRWMLEKVTIPVAGSSLPEIGGEVKGSGVYDYGDSVTLRARPAFGYVFNNWTENDTVISTDSVLRLKATGSHTLTANFIVDPILKNESPQTDSQRDYSIFYDPNRQVIHWVTSNGESLPLVVEIYSVQGMLMIKKEADESIDVSSLAKGNYILRWLENGKVRSVKFVKI